MQSVAKRLHDGTFLPPDRDMLRTKPPLQELEEAIQSLIVGSDSGLSIDAQKTILISENRHLIDALTPDWVSREVVRMIRRERLRMAQQQRQAEQYLLPGFEHLPQRIMVATGHRRPLANATYRQLREYLASLRKRHREDPRAKEVKTLMELVRKYASKNPGITVKEVCERETQRQ